MLQREKSTEVQKKKKGAKKREKAERAALTAAWERALGSRDSGRLLLFCGDPPPIFTIQRFTRAMLGRLPAGRRVTIFQSHISRLQFVGAPVRLTGAAVS